VAAPKGSGRGRPSTWPTLDTFAPEVILNAELPDGVEVRREGSSILVSTPDSQGFVTWPVAVKLGLIALGGK
jgi:hypothetical protein